MSLAAELVRWIKKK